MRFTTTVAIVTTLGLFATTEPCARDVTVGVVLDGPSQRQMLPLELLEREVAQLMQGEFLVRFPREKILDGGWTIDGIRRASGILLADPTVDIVITNGLLASHEISHIDPLPKPVIAPIVADPVLQRLPAHDGTSGRRNLVYLADDHTIGADLDLFHEMLGFRHLAILVDRLFLETLPELLQTTAAARARLGIDISLVPVEDDADAALAALPPGVDAVYIPPLPRVDETDMRQLAEQLIEKRLPSFALLGVDMLERGFLMTGSGRNVDVTRATRRVALNLQSILLGTDAGTLKVGLSQPQKLAINMRTARAIGYSPRWEELESAIVVNGEPAASGERFTLVEALQRTLSSNLALRIDDLDRAIAADQVQAARAGLLPQLSSGLTTTTIDRDRANPAFTPEREGSIGLSASQVIYSESLRANFDIARLLRDAQDQAFRQRLLDTIAATATAYLQVLQALAERAVRTSNVSVTELNLELAMTRRRIGQAGRADVLRWQSQLATDRQRLYTATADADQAATELKRILNLDLNSAIEVDDTGVPALIALLDSDRFQRFFDSPQKLSTFLRYHVELATRNAPELLELENETASVARGLLAARRAYYVPDLSITGQATTNLLRGGRGASLRGTGLDNDEWSIGLQATLPLYEGGARAADTSLFRHQLRQLDLQRDNVRDIVEARAIAAMQKAGGTYPAIRLSREAATAARSNLELVTQAYSVGTMSVTDLINAQDAALAAKLSEAQARYAFMIDFIEVLRSVADFGLLLEPDGSENWYRQADEYFARHAR
jgi:outer membrane protein TolC/ABC-type uncharacterized transport system substrate-binding protein